MAKETFERSKPHLTPVPPPTGDLTGVVIATTAGVITQFDASEDVGDMSGYYWKFQASFSQPGGRMSISDGQLIRICTVEADGLAGTVDLITPYGDRFGTVAVGSKIFVRAFIVDSVSGYEWDMGTVSAVVTGT